MAARSDDGTWLVEAAEEDGRNSPVLGESQFRATSDPHEQPQAQREGQKSVSDSELKSHTTPSPFHTGDTVLPHIMKVFCATITKYYNVVADAPRISHPIKRPPVKIFRKVS